MQAVPVTTERAAQNNSKDDFCFATRAYGRLGGQCQVRPPALCYFISSVLTESPSAGLRVAA